MTAMACPICGKLPEMNWRPFCSRRCADLDLGRWMTGAYALPDQGSDLPEVPEGDTGRDAGKLH